MEEDALPTHEKYAFILKRTTEEVAREAMKRLREIGARVLSRHGDAAFIALATPKQVDAAWDTELFSAISGEQIKLEDLAEPTPAQQQAVRLWNTLCSPDFWTLMQVDPDEDRSWNAPGKQPDLPDSPYDPEDFRRKLLALLGTDDEAIRAKFGEGPEEPPEGKDFVDYEQRLVEVYGDPTLAYQIARIVFYLPWAYRMLLLEMSPGTILQFLPEFPYWLMQREIAVGVVFVQSSLDDGPRFDVADPSSAWGPAEDEIDTLRALVAQGLDELAALAPETANLSWVYDWQYADLAVADAVEPDSEDYWRGPATGQVNYFGQTYTPDWDGLDAYREDMRRRNKASHALVIFLTPYMSPWHGYRICGRPVAVISKQRSYGGHGLGRVGHIVAHEVCHMFGACDEYTGRGTPCSRCDTTHGHYQIPNGNCGHCAQPCQDCLMHSSVYRLCPYTQAQIGWANLFVELTTADELDAGTTHQVVLNTGDHVWTLDTPEHVDRRQGYVDGYALNAPGLTERDVKRIGIHTELGPNIIDHWKLSRVRAWLLGQLLCDDQAIDRWFDSEPNWWVSPSAGTPSDIVNSLQVAVTTSDEEGAGKDRQDTVTLALGDCCWDLFKGRWAPVLTVGRTEDFDLYPQTGLYRSRLGTVRLTKSPDAGDSGWKVQGLRIVVNGDCIYDNQNINEWLEGDHLSWQDTI